MARLTLNISLELARLVERIAETLAIACPEVNVQKDGVLRLRQPERVICNSLDKQETK